METQTAIKLKNLYWYKLNKAEQGTLWYDSQKCGDDARAPEIDISELATLFPASNQNPDKPEKFKEANKPVTVSLIEHRRAFKCEIMLSQVKTPLHELIDHVLALDDSAMDIDLVDNLIKFCPTKEEMELIKGYKWEKEKLGKYEQFCLELTRVPRPEAKLRVFAYILQFNTQVSDLRNRLNDVVLLLEQVKHSVKLRRVMQTILSLGNALNQGTTRGAAVGFRLESVLKLNETRASGNKMTLMHYLCKVVADKLPELLDFSKELSGLEPASKIQIRILAEDMSAITRGFERVVKEKELCKNDGYVSKRFRKSLEKFIASVQPEVKLLVAVFCEVVGKKADELVLYFGEDPKRCPYEKVIATLLAFVRMFNAAHEENCKQIEADAEGEGEGEGEAEAEAEAAVEAEAKADTELFFRGCINFLPCDTVCTYIKQFLFKRI